MSKHPGTMPVLATLNCPPIVGFILGTPMLFHYGRTFEINDLAVAPEHQRQGIASELMDACLAVLKERGIVACI